MRSIRPGFRGCRPLYCGPLISGAVHCSPVRSTVIRFGGGDFGGGDDEEEEGADSDDGEDLPDLEASEGEAPAAGEEDQ